MSDEEDEFRQYQRKASILAEMRPYRTGEDMTGISVSDVDRTNGSPKEGDYIARDPRDRDQLWLVSAAYFAENFEPEPVGSMGIEPRETLPPSDPEADLAYARTGTNTRESLLRGPRGSEF